MDGVSGVVRPARPDDAGACAAITVGLPAHFTPEVPDRVRAAVLHEQAWVVELGTEVVGFLTVRRHPAGGGAEISWMAIRPGEQGRGLGSRLLDVALAALREDGVSAVLVMTLDRSAEYEPYLGTVRFWERHGFVQVATLDPFPGWEPGNPAALYVATLAVTAPDPEP